jgi:16S rRNA pseudouridine516 synthase
MAPADRVRLDALLARNLACSRRQARALISEGRVRATDGSAMSGDVAPPLDVVVDDRVVRLYEQAHVLLHKPAGVVTALRDARHATAYALLRDAPLAGELRPVGRLDLDTTGLLLWSTDGAVIQRLTHPKRAVPRTYEAALARPYRERPPGPLVLDDGHEAAIAALEPIDRASCHPALLPAGDATCWARIVLTGGAYHEVRRIFAALGSHVLALCRTSYGRLELPRDLPAGAWRPIDAASVTSAA